MTAKYEILDLEQGSEEWFTERLGLVTASRFCDVITGGKSADTYLWDLVSERLTGCPARDVSVPAMQWGHDQEASARAAYQFNYGVRLRQTGLVKSLVVQGTAGSPDGFVEQNGCGKGGVEIKCPKSSRIHLQYLDSGKLPKAYFYQVHGLMWICDRDWWDFVSYDPRMPENLQMFCLRIHRDELLEEELVDRVSRFAEQVKIKTERFSRRA